jgi:hypothetical protein
MLVINLFAPPGSGKSTLAAGVFYDLKSQGVNAELAGEFAKDLVWAGRQNCLRDQLYVFGKQHYRIHRLKNDVDVVVVDSPILLGLAYAEHYPDCFKQTVKWAFDQYNNLNFYVNRVKPYNPKGRNQTEEESDAKGVEIQNLLSDYKVGHYRVNGNDAGRKLIVDLALKKCNYANFFS